MHFIALVIAIAAALAITGCSDEEGTTGNSSDARLIKVVGHYNIVKFNGNVYGASHGVAIDWEKDDLKKMYASARSKPYGIQTA